MNTSGIPEIEIADKDVDNAEQYFKENFRYSFQNPGEREALKCAISRDIQAGPGSGKTRLLVAKLAILTSKEPLNKPWGIIGAGGHPQTPARNEFAERFPGLLFQSIFSTTTLGVMMDPAPSVTASVCEAVSGRMGHPHPEIATRSLS